MSWIDRNNGYIVAAKMHVCTYCGAVIQPGETYYRVRLPGKGPKKECSACIEKRFEDNDED